MQERVRAVLEYPRVACDSHYSWFNETIDGLVCRLHSSSIKKIPAHCCPAYNSRPHRKILNALADHVLRRVSYLFGL